MTITMTVDVHKDHLLNANQRLHWAQTARRTKALRQLGFLAWVRAGRPHLERARLVVTVGWPDRRSRDVHNLAPTWKACIDGMVRGPNPRLQKLPGLLPDDSDKYLIGPDPRVADALSGAPHVTRMTFDWTPLDTPGRPS